MSNFSKAFSMTQSTSFAFSKDDEEGLEPNSAWSKRMVKYGVSAKSTSEEHKAALLWAMLSSHMPEDIKSIEKYFVQHVEYSLARDRSNLSPFSAFQAVALSMRDRLVERWKDTQLYFRNKNCKRVAYLSLEYLLGRSLQNSVANLGLTDKYGQAMSNLGYKMEDLYDEEHDAGLGNGGLGRLAACFLDSLATLDYPAWGYGLRYKYGMFTQAIKDNCQIEFPDYWLLYGHPWEMERLDIVYTVCFNGHTKTVKDEKTGKEKEVWEPAEKVLAVAYDTPVPGYDTFNTLNIRLWSCRPTKEFDLAVFNSGNFYRSVEDKQNSERITSVLYPNDNTTEGKILRLKQQYFLVSATVQDLVRRFKQFSGLQMKELATHVAMQLNDTHPALAIAELMRILIDVEGLSWDEAWGLTQQTVSYTNHTVLPEALEKWSVDLLGQLLPRHLKIIYDINFNFLKEVELKYPGNVDKLRAMSIIEEGHPRMIRMANLAIVTSHAVNGVAAIHSDILKKEVFPDYSQHWPEKFKNITNGVTPRRWLVQCNPGLASVITAWLKSSNWPLNLDELAGLRNFAENPNLHKKWIEAKRDCKIKLAKLVEKQCNIVVDVDTLFDIQVKRIHEYKRQLLNILYVVYRYTCLKAASAEEKKKFVRRTVFFGGKAAPGYHMAKLIIRLINHVAQVLNADKETNSYLKVVFIPNYCVSLAENIVGAADISQHISTAGMEASGTSNMKFAMNGCLILGTWDGANIEIVQEIGHENAFIFGTRAEKVHQVRSEIKSAKSEVDARFEKVLHFVEAGNFNSENEKGIFDPILNSLRHGNDYYILSADFAGYVEAQEKVDQTWKEPSSWIKKSIMSTAGSGKFSSDRSIKEYAEKIWKLEPVRRPGPTSVSLDFSSDASEMFSPNALTGAHITLERMTPKERRSSLGSLSFLASSKHAPPNDF